MINKTSDSVGKLYYTIHRTMDTDINGDYFLLGTKSIAVYKIVGDSLEEVIYFTCLMEDNTEEEITNRLLKEGETELKQQLILI